MQVSFYYKNYSSTNEETFTVGYSTTTKDESAFTFDATTTTASDTQWHLYEGTFPANTKYIAIKYISDNKFYLYIDDFSATVPPTCIKPKGLTTGNVTNESVQLSWTSDADNFNVQYKKTADADWTDVSGDITATTYTLEGLTAETAYQVRVRTYCDASDQSDWTDAVAFTTKPAPITSFPYTEDFNTLTSGIPANWDNAEGTTTTASYKWNHDANGRSGACVKFNSYNNYSGNTNFLKTPAMNLPADKSMQLTFWYKNAKGGDFSVYISNDGGDTYTTELATGLINQADWVQKEIAIPSGFTNNVVIVFKGTSSYSTGDAYIYLDDVVVEEAPSCIKPKDLAVSNITDNSVDLAWTSDADNFNVQYKKAADENWTAVSTDITTASYMLTGLDAETAYQVRVQTDCGSGDTSAWTEAVDFTTKVAPIASFPYTEDFNSLTSGIPANWDNSEEANKSSYGSNYQWEYYVTGYGDDSHCVRFNSYNNNDGYQNALKTPAMNLPADKAMQLTFWYKNPAGGDFSVYISNDGGDTYETALITGLTGQSDWTQKLVSIPSTFTNNVVIVFKGTSNYASGDAYIYLDDVTVRETPATPIMVVKDGADNVLTTGYADAFGRVKAATSHTFKLKNEGAADLTVTSIESTDAAFTASIADEDKTIAGGAEKTFTVTLNYDAENLGDKSATITLTTNDGTFTIDVTGKTIDVNTWSVDFADGIPADWTNTGWTVSDGVATVAMGSAKYQLITPRLQAAAGETLTFEAATGSNMYYSTLVVSYSTDRKEWTEIKSLSRNETLTSWTAAEAGYYYLKFEGNGSTLDNLEGFKAAPLEHDLTITATTLPAEMNQYAWYTIKASVKENAGKEETATVKLIVDGVAQTLADSETAKTTKTIEANGTADFEFDYQPSEAITTAVEAYLEITYATSETVKSDVVSLTVAAAPVIDEEVGTVESFSNKAIVWKHSWKKGWNTMCLPFAIENTALAFGSDKFYGFTGYEDGVLTFSTVTALEAGKPYIFYTTSNDGSIETILQDITVGFAYTTPDKTTQGKATFQGTYAPIAAPNMEGKWGVTTAGKIQKGTDKASIKGFRGYFDLPAGADAPSLSIEDTTTGITTVIGADALNMDGRVYNLNGQRVENATKGLYIVNGRKVVVK